MTRVTSRSVKPPKTPDKHPRIGQHQGINRAKVPGPAPSRGKHEIKKGTVDIDGPRQRTDGAKVSRVYGSKEDIYDGVVFLPNITDTSFLHKCEKPISPLNKSNQDSSPARKDQVRRKPNCRLSPILVVAESEPAIATKQTTITKTTKTNEPHPSSWIFQGKATGEASDMISNHRSPSPLFKERTPPPSKDTPKEDLCQHSKDHYNRNSNKAEHITKGQQQKLLLSHSTIVTEIEMRLEAKFGARIAALEKQYAVLNRLFAAVLETASSTRLGGVAGDSKGYSLDPGAEEGLLQDRLSVPVHYLRWKRSWILCWRLWERGRGGRGEMKRAEREGGCLISMEVRYS